MSDNLFLSKIQIYNHRKLKQNGFNFYDIDDSHRFLYKVIFSEPYPSRILWRSDFNQKVIYALSDKAPVVNNSCDNAFSLQTKLINNSFYNYKYYAFNVRCNPIRRIGNKEQALLNKDEIFSWFNKRLEKFDCVIYNNKISLDNIEAKSINLKNKKMSFILNTCEISGVLCSNKAEHLKALLQQGIGRAKAYGYGLVQLLPIKNS